MQQPSSTTDAVPQPAAFEGALLCGEPVRIIGRSWRGGGRNLQIRSARPTAPRRIVIGPAVAGGAFALTGKGWICLSSILLGLGAFAVGEQPAAEPLGPCSRRTPLVISEIMYHPPAHSDGANLQFIELFNSQPWFADLSGFRLAGDIQYAFPEGTRLAANAFLVVAKVPADIQAAYSITKVVGPCAGDLGRSAGTVRLEHRSGAVLLEIHYANQPPWPTAPDGTGHSLVLSRPTFGERDPHAWSASAVVGGSPGGPEPAVDDPLRSVVINEVSAHPEGAQARFVELYNHSAAEIDLSGCSLSDDPKMPGFSIPPKSKIPAGGFVAFAEDQLGFAPAPDGGVIFLAAPGRASILDAVRYGAQAVGLPEGRSPNGGPVWRALIRPTPGDANAEFVVSDIVINEIMYHPISDAMEDEYVELFNGGSQAVDLGGWCFVDGIEFTFPTNTVLAAGGFLVVGKDAARLRTNYPYLSAANLLGDYRGSLSDSGERLALARPETMFVADGQGGLKSILANVLVDEVTYGEGGQWGEWADGGGSSLELINPHTDHRLAANWADSDESAKAEWTTIELTEGVDNYMGSGVSVSQNLLQVILLGPGECVLDDIEAMRVGETNLVLNPAFEMNLSSWLGRGNHSRVQWEKAGAEGGQLRLRTTGRGDPAANHLQGQCLRAFRKGDLATLRARARWLNGSPELLLRVPGNVLEAYGRLRVPANLGTPGLPNSRALPWVGPTITAVTHWPVLPATNQPVVITAQVQALDGLPAVVLNYRLDPSTNVVSVPMADDGLGDDTVAGDGIYSATILGQDGTSLIAFYILASESTHPKTVRMFPSDAPARECLVRIGERESGSQFGTYRLWMTDAVRRRWASREKLSNDPLPATFVNGSHRVIYGVGAMYSGSGYWAGTWTGPTGTPCDYSLTFPEDDRFLGATEATVSWPGLPSGYADPTAQSEQVAYWIAEQLGLPFNYRRYVVTYFNGVRRNAVMEDTQQPNRDLVEQWFPRDAAGELYKMQGLYDLDGQRLAWGSLEDFTIADSRQKLTRYRWNWGKRSARGAMNDYRSFFELVKTLNLPADGGYDQRVEQVIDLEQWGRTMAVERVVGNWDSFGYASGQNMYFYKPTAKPWQLLVWDIDFQMGGQVVDPPTTDLFTHQNRLFPDWTADSTTRRLFRHPPFRRAYLRALQEAVTGPLTHVNELIDAKAAAFAAQGLALSAPGSVKNYLSSRRAYIMTQLNKFRVPFAITRPTGDELRSGDAVVTFSGTASFEIQALRINGLPYSVTWTTVTNWSVIVPLRQHTNEFVVVGFDAAGQSVADASQSVTVICTGAAPIAPIRVVINEWMAANTKTLADTADGGFDDWFELYNPNAFPLDLSGYQLTDNLGGTARSIVPAGVILEPWGCLLVWADRERSQNDLGYELHVDFNLSRGGGSIFLLDPAGRVLDQIAFGAQTADISEGRWPDGTGTIYPLPEPTPALPNLSPETLAPLLILSADVSPRGIVTLAWTAEVGRRYRVQTKDRLDANQWTDGVETVAPDRTASVTLPTGASAEQYYRIEVLR